ncbi:MAG: DEAD/DEAH box helicase, partial [Armatimonadota bacterium]
MLLETLFPERRITTLRYPSRKGSQSLPPPGLNPTLVKALANEGLTEFYKHQALAFEAGLESKDVMVTTGTGSGKSLCALVPMLDKLLSEPVARALIVFPTKALAQDQATKLANMASPLGLRVGTYDGDTPKAHRSAIRKASHII